jgi:TRAP-type C4-dicarboxylate transport system substrate-binding protein
MSRNKTAGIISLITIALFIFTVVLSGYAAEPEGTYVCRLAHNHPETAPTGAKSLFLKQRFEKATNGRVTVKIYPHGQLVKDPIGCVEQASMGAIQMALGLSSYIASYDREWSIFTLPGLIDSPEHLLRVEKDPYFEELKKRLEKSGRLKVFTNMVYVKSILFSKRPVTKVEDIKGLKIRTYDDQSVKMAELMGAIGVPKASGEVAIGLQTGAIDAVFTSVNKGYIQTYGMVENCPYMLLNPGIPGYTCGWWVINADWWNGLPGEIQKTLEGLAPEIARECLRIENADEQATMKWALQQNMKPAESLPAGDIARLKQIWKPLYAEYTAKLGTKLLDAVEKAR